MSESASSASRVALRGAADEQLGVRALAPELLGGAVCGAPGGEALEVAAPGAVALARRAVGDHDHVTELGPTAVERAAEDEAAADPGAEREHDHVLARPALRPAATRRAPRRSRRSRPSPARRSARPSRGRARRPPAGCSRAERLPGRTIDHRRDPEPECADAPAGERLDRRRDPLQQLRLRAGRRPHLVPVERRVPSASIAPARIFVPPRSTPMTRLASTGRGYHTPPDGRRRKALPGLQGRQDKGKVPTAPRPERQQQGNGRRTKPPGRPRWRRRILLGVLILVVLLVVWTIASYLSFRAGVVDANARLPKTVEAGLARQDGALASKPSLILLLGTDGDKTAARADARRSDSILLVRTDPGRHRLAYLSIPRDLRVDIPGYGAEQDQRRVPARGPVPDDEDRPRADRPAAEPRRHRRLRRLPDGDRRARRGRDRRAEADPLEPLRLPVRDRRALPAVAGLAVREGQAEDERPARPHLLARAGEPARSLRQRPHARRAPAGRRRRDDRQARRPRHVRQAAVHRRRPRQAADDRPLGRPADAARLGQVPRQREPRAPLPARRRAVSRSAANPSSSGPRRTRPRSRCSPAARRRSRRRPARPTAPAASSAAPSRR